MTVSTLDQLGPVLASDLPPAPSVPGPLTRLRHAFTARRAARRFERALMAASPSEQSDLIAAARR